MKFRLVVCLALVPASCLWAASFDCAKARSPMEKQICSDPSLSAADEELGTVWRSTLKTFPLPAFLRKSQQLWLKEAADHTCVSKVQAADCLRAFKSRTELLGNLSRAKVYTNCGKEFSIDCVSMAVFDRGGESFLWMYGAWMPDMNNPQPPPYGFLLDEVSRIVKTKGKYIIDGRDYEIGITDRRIDFGAGLMITARQPQLAGAFQRVP
jgi:uncharacterized protein